jgi:hypothetical protein
MKGRLTDLSISVNVHLLLDDTGRIISQHLFLAFLAQPVPTIVHNIN